MVCKDEDAIKEKSGMLLEWIHNEPRTMLHKARLQNSATSMSHYLVDLNLKIKSAFNTSSLMPEKRSIHRERVIMRYVVHMQLQIVDRKKNSSVSPLSAYRNPATPIELSMSAQRKTQEHYKELSKVTERMMALPSFFDKEDRVQIGQTYGSEANLKMGTEDSILLQIDKEAEETLSKIDSRKSGDDIRFVSLRVATLKEVRGIHHRLVIRSPNGFDLYVYHSPMEVYVAWG